MEGGKVYLCKGIPITIVMENVNNFLNIIRGRKKLLAPK